MSRLGKVIYFCDEVLAILQFEERLQSCTGVNGVMVATCGVQLADLELRDKNELELVFQSNSSTSDTAEHGPGDLVELCLKQRNP